MGAIESNHRVKSWMSFWFFLNWKRIDKKVDESIRFILLIYLSTQLTKAVPVESGPFKKIGLTSQIDQTHPNAVFLIHSSISNNLNLDFGSQRLQKTLSIISYLTPLLFLSNT